MRPKYLVVAHANRPHGLRGDIEALSLTDYPERFKKGLTLYPSPPIPGIQSLVIEKVESRPSGLILKFKGIDTREDAERIATHDLVVPIEEAVKLGKDEYWIHEIIGMDVYTTGGEHLGHVTDVLRTGSNDVYVVENSKEHLIPAIKDVIKKISAKDRKIIIEPIPGLLD
ncbi:MAG: ribosome maturation factor RimM [Firmicutes bacterium]|nr:ribosome maturation factor RimM [Bacillota bacterium]